MQEMELIHPPVFLNNECEITTYTKLDYTLIDASSYLDDGRRFKWRNANHGLSSDIFGMVGDGMINNNIYCILRKQEEGGWYIVSRTAFEILMVECKS